MNSSSALSEKYQIIFIPGRQGWINLVDLLMQVTLICIHVKEGNKLTEKILNSALILDLKHYKPRLEENFHNWINTIHKKTAVNIN